MKEVSLYSIHRESSHKRKARRSVLTLLRLQGFTLRRFDPVVGNIGKFLERQGFPTTLSVDGGRFQDIGNLFLGHPCLLYTSDAADE